MEIYRGRRVHKRWLLEQRYEVYAAALVYIDELLTWARNEVTAPSGTSSPDRQSFPDFTARLSLVGTDRVQAEWRNLDASYRQFLMMHEAAINVGQAARSAGHAARTTRYGFEGCSMTS